MTLPNLTFSRPTQCVLWDDPARVRGNDLFEIVEIYYDDEHFFRRLLRCKECGQQYFYEMYEEIDWEDGEDPQYRKWIPVNTLAEIDSLKATSTAWLIQASPAIHSDFPKGVAEPKVFWVGK